MVESLKIFYPVKIITLNSAIIVFIYFVLLTSYILINQLTETASSLCYRLFKTADPYVIVDAHSWVNRLLPGEL